MSTAPAPVPPSRRGIAIGLGICALLVVASLLLGMFVIGPRMGWFLLPATPQQYGANVLDRLAAAGVDAHGDAWDRTRRDVEQRLAGATTIADAQELLRPALAAAGGGSIMPADAKPRPVATADQKMPTVRRDGRVTTVTLPSVLTEDGTVAAVYTDTAYQGIRDNLAGTCGYVVDLRGSAGGGLWARLAGVATLLPDGTALDLVDRSGRREPIRVARQTIEFRGSVRASTGEAAKPVEPPIAVLVDGGTAGDGAVLARAFRGVPNVRFYGTPLTGGGVVTTRQQLSDGALLDFATARYVSRDGSAPDRVDVVGDDAAGRDWVSSQCR